MYLKPNEHLKQYDVNARTMMFLSDVGASFAAEKGTTLRVSTDIDSVKEIKRKMLNEKTHKKVGGWLTGWYRNVERCASWERISQILLLRRRDVDTKRRSVREEKGRRVSR